MVAKLFAIENFAMLAKFSHSENFAMFAKISLCNRDFFF